VSGVTVTHGNINALDRDELALTFLRHVLPPEGAGLYCLWVKGATGRVQNIFVPAIEVLWQKNREYDRGGRGNVYFGIATFKDNSGREAANARAFLPLLNSFGDTGTVIRPKFGPKPDYLRAVTGRTDMITAWAGLEPFPSSDAMLVAEACAQIKFMRDQHGVMPEPEWRGCLSVLKFCEGGDELAHEWSKGDDRYTCEETQRKLDAIQGPHKCETFSGMNGHCEGCPHKGKITSPIELGRPAVAAAPAPIGMKWVLGQGGRIRERNYPNAMTAIAALGIECRHDVFHDKKLVAGDMTDNFGPELSDAIARAVREQIAEQDSSPRSRQARVYCGPVLRHPATLV
jgi:hypothetical protein